MYINPQKIRAKLGEISEGFDIVEQCLARATKADRSDVPLELDDEQAAIWHRAQQEAYRHVLEMCNADSLKEFIKSI